MFYLNFLSFLIKCNQYCIKNSLFEFIWLRNYANCAARFDSVIRVKLYCTVIIHISEYDFWCFCSYNAIIFYSKLCLSA